MILVKTKLGQSFVHGIGLFAAEFIPRNTVTWKHDPRFDQAFSETDIAAMSESAREQVLCYAFFYHDIGKFVLCFDDQRFINHSSHSANIMTTPEQDVAARDILGGEELLCDYRKFDREYFTRRNVNPSTLR